MNNFSPDANLTVLIREGARGSNPEGTFSKEKGRVVAESRNTPTILPSKGQPKFLSKRDVAP